jgi:hypothetical protein
MNDLTKSGGRRPPPRQTIESVLISKASPAAGARLAGAAESGETAAPDSPFDAARRGP